MYSNDLELANHYSVLFHLWMESKHVLKNILDFLPVYSLVLHIIICFNTSVPALYLRSPQTVLQFSWLNLCLGFQRMPVDFMLITSLVYHKDDSWPDIAYLSVNPLLRRPQKRIGYLKSLLDFAWALELHDRVLLKIPTPDPLPVGTWANYLSMWLN